MIATSDRQALCLDVAVTDFVIIQALPFVGVSLTVGRTAPPKIERGKQEVSPGVSF